MFLAYHNDTQESTPSNQPCTLSKIVPSGEQGSKHYPLKLLIITSGIIQGVKDELKKVIGQSSFRVEDGVYVYAKVATLSNINEHFMVTSDKDEITVVTKEKNLGSLDLIERNMDNYKLIAL